MRGTSDPAARTRCRSVSRSALVAATFMTEIKESFLPRRERRAPMTPGLEKDKEAEGLAFCGASRSLGHESKVDKRLGDQLKCECVVWPGKSKIVRHSRARSPRFPSYRITGEECRTFLGQARARGSPPGLGPAGPRLRVELTRAE